MSDRSEQVVTDEELVQLLKASWDGVLDPGEALRIEAARLITARVAEAKRQAWIESAAWVDENDPGWGDQVRDANPYLLRDGKDGSDHD